MHSIEAIKTALANSEIRLRSIEAMIQAAEDMGMPSLKIRGYRDMLAAQRERIAALQIDLAQLEKSYA